jgi:hypothetical protein
MAEAIFGLVGVIIGGLITAGADWLRHHTVERTRRRLAARLPYDELQWRRVVLEAAAEAGHESVVLDPSALLELWVAHRSDLASLPWSDWKPLHLAVGMTSRLDLPAPENSAALRNVLERAETAVLKHAGGP